jgi:hypothetical protein
MAVIGKIYISDDIIKKVNSKIFEYINKTYGQYGFDYNRCREKHFNITLGDNFIINTEILTLMVNNRIVFENVVKEYNIKDEQEFLNFMLSNLDNIYYYKSKFFKEHTLPIIKRTLFKGKKGENDSIKKFIKIAKSKGIDVEIISSTPDEDQEGKDFLFKTNNSIYSMQVKPFTSYKIIGNKIHIRSRGDLRLKSPNYLMLYFDDFSYILLKNPKNNKIIIYQDVYVSSIDNIVYIDD